MNVFQYLAALDTLDAACDAGLISNANLSQGVACLSAAYEEQEAAAKTQPVNSPARIVATPAAVLVRPVYSTCAACNGDGLAADDAGTICAGCLGSGGSVIDANPTNN